MRKVFVAFLFLIPAFAGAFELRQPMDLPIELAANCGELRPNHFHSGLDMKTNQQIGQPVYTVYDGYLARINVSPVGYGNCLYVNHPEIGLTSVYAHLDSFEPAIDSILKAKQYELGEFAVDFNLDSLQVPLKKGERIATSGNSGSSGGPHLHFEIRDMVTEEVHDPQLYYHIEDNTRPRFHKIYIVPMPGEGVVAGSAEKKGYTVESLKSAPVKAYGRIGIDVRANDYMSGNANIYGVHSLKVEVDGVTTFHYELEKFSFDSTRYINSFIDYALWYTKREMTMKTYLPDNPCLQYIKEQKGSGYIIIDENRDYKVKLTIDDFRGNTNTLNFTIKGDSTVIPVISAYNGGEYFNWNIPNELKKEHVYFYVPRGSLYNSIYFKYAEISDSTGYSNIHQMHYATEPLQKFCTLVIDLTNDTLKNKSAYYLAQKDRNGNWSYMGGTYIDGAMEVRTRTLGDYKVLADTTAPAVTFLGKVGDVIKFRISDSQSGIGGWSAKIDGKPAIFAYDAKSKLIYYKFDPKRVEQGKSHNIELSVSDKCGNTTVRKAKALW